MFTTIFTRCLAQCFHFRLCLNFGGGYTFEYCNVYRRGGGYNNINAITILGLHLIVFPLEYVSQSN